MTQKQNTFDTVIQAHERRNVTGKDIWRPNWSKWLVEGIDDNALGGQVTIRSSCNCDNWTKYRGVGDTQESGMMLTQHGKWNSWGCGTGLRNCWQAWMQWGTKQETSQEWRPRQTCWLQGAKKEPSALTWMPHEPDQQYNFPSMRAGSLCWEKFESAILGNQRPFQWSWLLLGSCLYPDTN